MPLTTLLTTLLLTLTLGEPVSVHFVAVVPDLPAAQPPAIFLASDADNWKPAARRLPKVADGLYIATIELPPGQKLRYKFTRTGLWRTVEKAADGGELPNRQLSVPADVDSLVIVHHVQRWADRPAPSKRQVRLDAESTAASRTQHTLTGDIHFHNDFPAPSLNNKRTIAVYLPPGYRKDSHRRYPVLYMHDGNNIFDAATSFSGVEWQADETAEKLIKAGKITPLIIVGIYNTPERHNEYTPWRDEGRGVGGRGNAYLDFIVDYVKPFIDRTYRTHPQRAHTGIAGASLGGLISLYAACEHPDVFGRVAAVSPSLWWNEGAILEEVRALKLPGPTRIWLDMGTAEGHKPGPHQPSRFVSDARKCVQIIRAHAANLPGLVLEYKETPEGKHHESSWAARFDQVLVFLYGQDEASKD